MKQRQSSSETEVEGASSLLAVMVVGVALEEFVITAEAAEAAEAAAEAAVAKSVETVEL